MDKNIIPGEMDIMKMSLFIKVISDSTRLKILFAIKKKPRAVSEIVEIVGATQSAVSHQLSIMRGVNIVDTKREGNKIFYLLADEKINKILDIVKCRI